MNIFTTSRNTKQCARDLDNKRLNKMILETTQMLCSSINLSAGKQITPYRTCHANHPIMKWVRFHHFHSRWLHELGIAYSDEIIYRFDREHACLAVLQLLAKDFPEETRGHIADKLMFHNGARHLGLGIDFTHLPVHKAYKEYLNTRWPGDARRPVWTRRDPPKWKWDDE